MTHDIKTTNASLVSTAPEPLVSPDVTLAANQCPTEDSALALLERTDLLPDLVEKLSKSPAASSRKVRLAMVRHPNTPRYVSLSVMRHMFTFDLMKVALTPVVAGDIKVAAEGLLINRLETISPGEKLSLARRASGRVAAELLLDAEARVMQAALENPRLTEALVTNAVLRDQASPALVRAVCTHVKWSLRKEIRIAVLRNEYAPAEIALEFAQSLPDETVREILQNSRLREDVKTCLARSSER